MIKNIVVLYPIGTYIYRSIQKLSYYGIWNQSTNSSKWFVDKIIRQNKIIIRIECIYQHKYINKIMNMLKNNLNDPKITTAAKLINNILKYNKPMAISILVIDI